MPHVTCGFGDETAINISKLLSYGMNHTGIDASRFMLRTGSCFVHQVNSERVWWRKHSKEDSKFSKKKIFVSVSEPLWRQIFDRRLVIKPKIKETNSIKPHRVTPGKNSPYKLKFNINSWSTVHFRANVHFLDHINSISKLTACFFQCSVKIVIFD